MAELARAITGPLGPAERRAMREIVEAAHLVDVNGQPYLVSPVSAEAIDALAAFEAEGEDLEDEPDSDREHNPVDDEVSEPQEGWTRFAFA